VSENGGWGGLGQVPMGGWKCDTCLVLNGGDATECVSCGSGKAGPGGSVSGMGGFHFGAGVAVGNTGNGASLFGFGSGGGGGLSWATGSGRGVVFGAPASSVSPERGSSADVSVGVSTLKSTPSFQFGSGFGVGVSSNAGGSVVPAPMTMTKATPAEPVRSEVRLSVAGLPSTSVGREQAGRGSLVAGNSVWFDVSLRSEDGVCEGLGGRVVIDVSDSLGGALRAAVIESAVRGEFAVGSEMKRVVAGSRVDLSGVSRVGGVWESLTSMAGSGSGRSVNLGRGSVWMCTEDDGGVGLSVIVGRSVEVCGVGCVLGSVRLGLRVGVCVVCPVMLIV
jgi:hypothetical protein